MSISENNRFMKVFGTKFVNFIKNLSKNLEFFEEKVYKGYVFLYKLF